MSQIEGSLAKVDQMEELMTLIASKMGLVPEPINSTLFFHENPSIVPPTPVAVRVRSPAGPRPSHAAPDSQCCPRFRLPVCSRCLLPRPDGARPLTHEGAPSDPRTPSEIRQSSVDAVRANASQTDVGSAG
jgi:hypothetical protein